jgi:hypothetical protein
MHPLLPPTACSLSASTVASILSDPLPRARDRPLGVIEAAHLVSDDP